MADQQIEDLGALLTPAVEDQLVINDVSDTTDDAGGTPKKITLATLGALIQKTETGDSNISGLVGRLHVVTMNFGPSPWSAVRTFTLPTTFAVDELCGIFIVDGDPTHEAAIRTGATGDLIRGVDYSAVDFTKLFIPGELMIFRGLVANTEWACIHDGRIPCYAKIRLTATSNSFTSSATWSTIDANGSSEIADVGDIMDATSGDATVRRAGRYAIRAAVGTGGNAVDGESVGVIVVYDPAGANATACYQNIASGAAAAIRLSAMGEYEAADGGLFRYTAARASGTVVGGANDITSWSIRELL